MNVHPPAWAPLPPHHHSGAILPGRTCPSGFFPPRARRVTRSPPRSVRSTLRPARRNWGACRCALSDVGRRAGRDVAPPDGDAREEEWRQPAAAASDGVAARLCPEWPAPPRARADLAPVGLLGPHLRHQVVHLLARLGGQLPQLVGRRQAAPDEPLRDGTHCRTRGGKDDGRCHGRTDTDQETPAPSLRRGVQETHDLTSFTKSSHSFRCTEQSGCCIGPLRLHCNSRVPWGATWLSRWRGGKVMSPPRTVEV